MNSLYNCHLPEGSRNDPDKQLEWFRMDRLISCVGARHFQITRREAGVIAAIPEPPYSIGSNRAMGEGASFKRFAEKVRSHLFDLSRIGETSTAVVIERICLKLYLQDRLAWNANRHGRLEERSLNEFGFWFCSEQPLIRMPKALWRVKSTHR